MIPVCWAVAQGLAPAGSCDGRLIRAHLIPKQRLRRELRAGRTNPELREVMWEGPAEIGRGCWVWMCGGPTGIGGHHGQLDYAGVNRLIIPRSRLPRGLEAYAERYGLEWSLEADYGPREVTTA